MKRLNYVKPVCEVVEVEREGYILCASYMEKTQNSEIEDMTGGTGWGDAFGTQETNDVNRTF